MIEYKDVVEYLNYEYPYVEDLMGLVTDLVNDVTSLAELKEQIIEYREHND